MMTLNKS